MIPVVGAVVARVAVRVGEARHGVRGAWQQEEANDTGKRTVRMNTYNDRGEGQTPNTYPNMPFGGSGTGQTYPSSEVTQGSGSTSFSGVHYGPPAQSFPGDIGGQVSGSSGVPMSSDQHARPLSPTPPHVPPSSLQDDDDDLQMNVTTRMARLSRDPEYRKAQRTLANRRRLRSVFAEFMLLLDLALSLALLWFLTQYRVLLAHFHPFDISLIAIAKSLLPGGFEAPLIDRSTVIAVAAIILVCWPVVFSLMGLYRTDWSSDLLAPFRAARAVLVTGLVASGMLYVFQLHQPRSLLLAFIVLDTVLLTLSRVLVRPIVAYGIPRRRVLIIGTGRLAVEAARMITARRSHGLELVGVTGTETQLEPEPDLSPEWITTLRRRWVAYRLGDLQDVPQIVRKQQVDLVLIALQPRERAGASRIISSLAHLPVQVCVMPDVVAETAKTAFEVVDGMPVLGLTESAISGWNMRLKRLMDLVICVPLLLVLWPLLLIITVLIRLNSPGPALFKQERIGQHNRRFLIYKFRTMYVDADRRAQEMAIKTEQGLVHKRRDDPRITSVGAFLRKTSLDELPQLINVLKGDMSVVGPRPELPWIVERYRAWQYRRLLVPQGITGWWQVHGRSDRVLHLHTQDDIYYVRNYSLWLDIKILLMTIKVVLTGKGAF